MDAQQIIDGLIAFVLAVLGWLGRQLWSTAGQLRKDLTKLEIELPKTYMAKTDMERFEERIMERFNRLESKLDGKADK